MMQESGRLRAVIFDLGGVVFPSPFDAFDKYEAGRGLPRGSLRGVIRTSSETGAWAALERGELTHEAFQRALEVEASRHGIDIDAGALMTAVGSGFGPRPDMLRALTRIREEGLRTGALTNNWPTLDGATTPVGIHDLGFDAVVESAVVGLRKPDPRIYELICTRLAVAPEQAVFLDDLGVNLKPARAMGMTTIKVADPSSALAELAALLGFTLE